MSNQSRRVNQFFANLIAKIRKLLIKIGSPFRISRRTVRMLQNQSRSSQAGFVLPTVTLVTVVVTLLVVTMVARSSDRARSASNARVEQTFANSAKPALDRARAKIEDLINSDKLPRTTPPESKLEEVITLDGGRYTFSDETRLQLVSDFLTVDTGANKLPSAVAADGLVNYTNATLANREYVSTAWKFPIDTDNNGKFDSIGLYSILFRTRPAYSASNSITKRQIAPIEARALPLDESVLSDTCVGAATANVATNEGWIDAGTKLKKSFFVYAITAPITDLTPIPTTELSKYESYSGNRSFSGLELQQDRARLPRNNNAVWFEGDIELARPVRFRINGRIYSSGNLMVGAFNSDNPVTFYQVSSPDSCYFTEENSKIIVAGNVVEGDAITADTTLSPGNDVPVHLFKGKGINPLTTTDAVKYISDSNQTVTNVGQDVAFNEFAYSKRITALVEAAIALGPQTISTNPTPITIANINSPDPKSVKQDIVKRINDEGLSGTVSFDLARRKSFEVYFGERTRKVPFIEVPSNATDTQIFGSYYATHGSTGTFLSTLFNEPPNPIGISGTDTFELSPPLDWMIPLDSNTGDFTSSIAAYNSALNGRGLLAGTSTNSLKINTISPALVRNATTDPIKQKDTKEVFLGDRLLVGNNLPAKWVKDIASGKTFVGNTEDNFFTTTTGIIKYNDPKKAPSEIDADTNERVRKTQAATLDSLGVSDRGGFWELSAADDPASNGTPATIEPTATPTTGGLRVLTNAGIFSRQSASTFLPRYISGVADNPATTDIDESGAPVVNNVTQLPSGTLLNTGLFNPPKNTALTPNDANQFVVWPDSMPMTQHSGLPGPDNIYGTGDDIDPETRKGDLQMRATAIYHYKYSAYDPAVLTDDGYQKPVACVSSYYDPSTPTTAKNAPIAGNPAPWNPDPNGRSNNGIVYVVDKTAASIEVPGGYNPTTGIFAFASGAQNPYDSDVNLGDRLAYQANLIYPNGRFVNEPLRDALIQVRNIGGGDAAKAALTLPQQSTLDSNICALQIMDGTLVVKTGTPPVLHGVTIPHGSFREAAFLDGREVKALNRNETLTEAANGADAALGGAAISKNRADIYDLEIEQRQPLEIRVTDIDMDRLRGSTATGSINTGVTTDFLLPYSGLIYASRDDALRDQSYFDIDDPNPALGNPTSTETNKRNLLSASDSRLDPTRRPNGIRLINGVRLWRSTLVTANLGNADGLVPLSEVNYADPSYAFSEATKGEKGLILVSNLPVYVKAQRDPTNATTLADPTKSGFNLHTQQEFGTGTNVTTSGVLKADWSNFYDRKTSELNGNFACRPKQNVKCNGAGDEWRQATIIADSPTTLSAAFVDGFRSDGDYDIRNNANTSTSINWQSSLNSNTQKAKDSPYVIQRRRIGYYNNNFVTSANWLPPATSTSFTDRSNLFPANNTAYGANERRTSYNANGVTPIQRRLAFGEYNMEICRKFPVENCGLNDWVKARAGTTALPDRTGSLLTPVNAPRYIDPIDDRFPRRVSFLRYDDIYADGNQALVMAGTCPGNNPVWPIPIGVTNGNTAPGLSGGFTYPQPLGNLAVPYNTANSRTYGDVPCPPTATTTIEIVSDSNQVEGKFLNNIDTVFAPAIDASNYATQTTGAGGNSSLPYSRFPFTVRVNNLGTAAGNVTANISIAANGGSNTNARVGLPGFSINDYNGLVTNGDYGGINLDPSTPPATANAALVDVLDRVFVADSTSCRDASGTPILQGTPITSVVFLPSAPAFNTCNVVALVTRDNLKELEEQFQIQLSTLVNATAGTALIRTGRIQVLPGTAATPAGESGNSNPICPVTSPVPAVSAAVGDDRPIPPSALAPVAPSLPCTVNGTCGTANGVPRASAPTAGLCDAGTPTGVSSNGINWTWSCNGTGVPTGTSITCSAPIDPNAKGMLPPPVFGLIRNTFSFRYSGLPGAVIIPNISNSLAAAYPTSAANNYPTSSCPFPIVDGTYNCAAATTPPIRYSGNSIFGAGRQVPLKPNEPVGTTAGDIPMLPGMSPTVPVNQPRSLWFRTTRGLQDPIGISSRTTYDSGRNLMVYNQSWPSISSSASNQANLNQPGRLVLPDTVCIDTADGSVDALCRSTSTTLVNLNIPFNPHFPSNNASATGTSSTRPASTYAVCGVNGASQNYQSTEISGSTDITGNTCPTAPRAAIATAMGRFMNPSLNPADATFKGQGFVSPAPTVNAVNPTASPITRTITITAANTHEINKVNVINLTGLDNAVTVTNLNLSDSWKTACPATPNTLNTLSGIIRLKANPDQPSPVFILRSCENQDLLLDNFKLQLDGVEPNNVFWVVPRLTPNLTTPSKALTIQTTSIPLNEANIAAGGSGYAVGNVLDVIGGSSTTATQLTVTSVNGAGAVTGVSVSTPGSYSIFPSNPVSVSGGGTGATFNLSPSTVVSGNFLGIMPATVTADRTTATTLNIRNTAPSTSAINVSLRSTRFLGFRAFSANAPTAPNPASELSDGIDSRSLVAAMTTTNQPIVLPVLQIHSPTTTSAGGVFIMSQPANPDNNDSMTGFPPGDAAAVPPIPANADTAQWTQSATDSEINVYFVAGIVPSRSKIAYTTSIQSNFGINLVNPNTAVTTAETGGGLHNFIRLLENWTSKNLKITGGFIQNTKSSYGTAPFSNTAPYGNASDALRTSDIQTLFVNPLNNTTATQSLSGFRKVYQSGTVQRIPYYSAPNRLWGFDVGLLTQSADRFAERFASAIPGANEFLREVDANDPWVKTLLCAAQPDDPLAINSSGSAVNPNIAARLGTIPANYTAFALGVGDRPTGCTPLNYN